MFTQNAIQDTLTELSTNRHPSTREVVQWFEFTHLPPHLQQASRPYTHLAAELLAALPDSPELTVALRKLLESKDAAVRCAVAKERGEGDRR